MEPTINSYFMHSEVGSYLHDRWSELKKLIGVDSEAGQNLYTRRNTTCDFKWTSMHLVCQFESYEEFENAVQPLSGMQRVVIFQRQTVSRTTPIMRLLANGSIHDSSAIEKCLELIFRESSHSEARDMLSMTDNQGNVIAHAAQWNCPQAIAYLLSLVECEPKKQLELMNVLWRSESDKRSIGGESGFSNGNEEPPSHQQSKLTTTTMRNAFSC